MEPYSNGLMIICLSPENVSSRHNLNCKGGDIFPRTGGPARSSCGHPLRSEEKWRAVWKASYWGWSMTESPLKGTVSPDIGFYLRVYKIESVLFVGLLMVF
jgi:hypothetical protein